MNTVDEPDRIEAPVAMPGFVRVIAMILIGLPGGLIWLGGLFTTMGSMVYTIVSTPAERPAFLLLLGAALAASLIGYSVVAATSWLNGSHHYRMSGHRLPAYVALEILDQLLAVTSVGFLVVSAISISFGKPAYPLLWLLATAAGTLLLGFTTSFRSRRGDTWRDELLEGPEGAKPPY